MSDKGIAEVDEDTAQWAAQLANYVPDTEEEKKLVRRIDLFLMPILWIMYILNYIGTCLRSLEFFLSGCAVISADKGTLRRSYEYRKCEDRWDG